MLNVSSTFTIIFSEPLKKISGFGLNNYEILMQFRQESKKSKMRRGKMLIQPISFCSNLDGNFQIIF